MGSIQSFVARVCPARLSLESRGLLSGNVEVCVLEDAMKRIKSGDDIVLSPMIREWKEGE